MFPYTRKNCSIPINFNSKKAEDANQKQVEGFKFSSYNHTGYSNVNTLSVPYQKYSCSPNVKTAVRIFCCIDPTVG